MNGIPTHYRQFQVWAHWESDKWDRTAADTFEDAVAIRENEIRRGCTEVIITEYIPLAVKDGRKKGTVVTRVSDPYPDR